MRLFFSSALRGGLADLENDPWEERDVLKEHPEKVAELKKVYREWFAEVSATRKNNYAAPRIRIGSVKENPTVLTGQDRREANAEDKNGHWSLSVVREGDFEMEVRLLEAPEAGTLRIRAGEESAEMDWPVFSVPVFTLPKGPLRLEAWIEDAKGKTRAVDFVTIRGPVT